METGMAEGLLGGILGEEDEKPDVEASETLAGADAFAAAVAARLSASDPDVARDTSTFLKKQAHLLEIQAEHLKDEHADRLHFLQGQAREVDIRRLGLRLRVGFQLVVALVATTIGLGFVVMVWDAMTSRRVVVDAFHTVPSAEMRGLDGVVVASGVLDELNRLQEATRSDVRKLDQSTAWASQVKMEVPTTGISVGEISQWLRERYGHDVHINGEFTESPEGGLALTIRGNGVTPRTFRASASAFEKLTTQAAEHVYAQSQPVRWAYYLQDAGRFDEAVAFCRSTIQSANREDRPYLLNVWANAAGYQGLLRESLDLYREAVRLKPEFWDAYSNIQLTLMDLAQEEDAWQAGEQMRTAAGGRPGQAPEIEYRLWDTLTRNLGARLNALLADAEANAGVGTLSGVAGLNIALIYEELHDPSAADLAIKTTVDLSGDPLVTAITHFVRGRLAAVAGDTVTAAAEMEAFGVAYASPRVSGDLPGLNCWVAPAEEAAGHSASADALLKTAGRFVDCYRFRADILDGRGDWAGAQKAYEEAVVLAPDLPSAYYSWGVALLKHGDHAGAEAKLAGANMRGPHWADPLKAWGDVLVKQGHTKEALAKYKEALKYAPNWKQLKDAREALAKQKL
jgi:tetratricopeptide (TPR) repeat protein